MSWLKSLKSILNIHRQRVVYPTVVVVMIYLTWTQFLRPMPSWGPPRFPLNTNPAPSATDHTIIFYYYDMTGNVEEDRLRKSNFLFFVATALYPDHPDATFFILLNFANEYLLKLEFDMLLHQNDLYHKVHGHSNIHLYYMPNSREHCLLGTLLTKSDFYLTDLLESQKSKQVTFITANTEIRGPFIDISVRDMIGNEWWRMYMAHLNRTESDLVSYGWSHKRGEGRLLLDSLAFKRRAIPTLAFNLRRSCTAEYKDIRERVEVVDLPRVVPRELDAANLNVTTTLPLCYGLHYSDLLSQCTMNPFTPDGNRLKRPAGQDGVFDLYPTESVWWPTKQLSAMSPMFQERFELLTLIELNHAARQQPPMSQVDFLDYGVSKFIAHLIYWRV